MKPFYFKVRQAPRKHFNFAISVPELWKFTPLNLPNELKCGQFFADIENL